MGKRKKIILFLFVGLVCLFPFQSSWAAKTKRPIVFVETVKSTKIFDQLSYPARLISKVNAAILSESEGVVVSVKKPLGKSVLRGQEVIRVKHTDPVFNYAPVKVRAPVNGVISSIEVTVGSQVKKGQKLATVTDPKRVRAFIEVASSDLSSISQGLNGKLRITGKKKLVDVKVAGVSPFVDPATGTATAELVILDKKILIPPGMVGRVSFEVDAHEGFQVPENAVVYRGKDTFLRVIEEGKAKLSPVTLGPSRRGTIEILEGVDEGAVIVVRASQFISNGEEVTVQDTGAKKKKKEVE